MHMIDSWVGANLVGMYLNYSDAILTFFFLLIFSCNLLKYWIKELFFYISFPFIFHYFKFIVILINFTITNSININIKKKYNY